MPEVFRELMQILWEEECPRLNASISCCTFVLSAVILALGCALLSALSVVALCVPKHHFSLQWIQGLLVLLDFSGSTLLFLFFCTLFRTNSTYQNTAIGRNQ